MFSKGVPMSVVCLKARVSSNIEGITLFRVTRKPELLRHWLFRFYFLLFFLTSQCKLHIRRGVIGIWMLYMAHEGVVVYMKLINRRIARKVVHGNCKNCIYKSVSLLC